MNEIVRELQYNSQLEALRDYTIKTQDEEEDEDAEDDDNQVEDENDDPDGEMANYSGEGDLDIVRIITRKNDFKLKSINYFYRLKI